MNARGKSLAGFSLAALAGLSLLTACSSPDADTRRLEAVGAGDGERVRYVQASIEIACLTREPMDPRQLAARTLVVYRRYGFDPVMSYLLASERYGTQPDVQQQISAGIEACP